MIFIFIKGILAGIAIGFGGMISIGMRFIYKVTNTTQQETENIISAIAFSAGLLIVCSCKLFLYTGKIGMLFERKQERTYYISLPIMLLGNSIGSIGFGIGVHYLMKLLRNKVSNKFSLYDDLIASLCNKRIQQFTTDIANGYIQCCIKSMLCGYCVYMAVKCFNRKISLGNVLLLVFYVWLFVYTGYEHCIANMFYFACNFKHNTKQYIDIAICIVGNAIGTIPGVYSMINFNIIDDALCEESTSTLIQTQASSQKISLSFNNKSQKVLPLNVIEQPPSSKVLTNGDLSSPRIGYSTEEEYTYD